MVATPPPSGLAGWSPSPSELGEELRAAIVAEARSWIDTPFHWGQAAKGVGCDCKGLIYGVARAVGLAEAEAAIAGFTGYRDRPDVRLLERSLAALLDPVGRPELRPGDVLQLVVARKPMHLAIYAGADRLIHTAAGLRRVREVPMRSAWGAAVHQVWTWRSL